MSTILIIVLLILLLGGGGYYGHSRYGGSGLGGVLGLGIGRCRRGLAGRRPAHGLIGHLLAGISSMRRASGLAVLVLKRRGMTRRPIT
jgi:hypothetical protein